MNNNDNKIQSLKQKIDAIESKKKNLYKKEKGTVNANFGFKISTEIVAALVVGVGIGLIVDNYFNTKPLGLIIFFILNF